MNDKCKHLSSEILHMSSFSKVDTEREVCKCRTYFSYGVIIFDKWNSVTGGWNPSAFTIRQNTSQ